MDTSGVSTTGSKGEIMLNDFWFPKILMLIPVVLFPLILVK